MYSRTGAQKYIYTEKEEHRRMGTQENRYKGEYVHRRKSTAEKVDRKTDIQENRYIGR